MNGLAKCFAELISLAPHDHGYDLHLLRFGPILQPMGINAFFVRVDRGLRRRGLPAIGVIYSRPVKYRVVDQMLRPGVLHASMNSMDIASEAVENRRSCRMDSMPVRPLRVRG